MRAEAGERESQSKEESELQDSLAGRPSFSAWYLPLLSE